MASSFVDVAALGFTYSEEMSVNGKDDIFDMSALAGGIANASPLLEDCVCQVNDIIILAEFSEIKGPIPLLTIPLNQRNELGVDIDDFILKIMSVDYQASASVYFKFSNDTQVLQTDVVDGIHAYVHYFSLNDLVARGFVRPLCLAYISKNRAKLESNVILLQERFSQISNLMKCDNRNLFLEEVSLGLQYLKEIQFRYFNWKEMQEDDEECSNVEDEFLSTINLDQMVDQQNEYNKILQSARCMMKTSDLYDDISRWRCGFAQSKQPEIVQYMGFVKLMVGTNEPIVPNYKVNEGYMQQNVLRPIAAISPFGIAVSVWILCTTHVQFHSCYLELRGGCFWNEDDRSYDAPQANQQSLRSCIGDVNDALSSAMYLQLLVHLLPLSAHTFYGANLDPEKSLLDRSTNVESGVVTSGNEASSSYYSAIESLNEAGCAANPFKNSMPFLKHGKLTHHFEAHVSSGSSESLSELTLRQSKTEAIPFFGDESSSDSADYPDDKPEIYDFPMQDLWCKCIWNGNIEVPQGYPGQKILHFFQTFSKVAQHILYSVLTGRTVVIAGSNNIRQKVWKIISAIVYFVPTQQGAKYLRWHKGILVSAHIEKYKVIGLCVPERLTVHDMISPRDKNAVTILDVNSKRIFGRAYSGGLLSQLEESFYNNFVCDESLVLYLQSVFLGIRRKVFLFKALNLENPGLSPASKSTSANDVLLTMGIKGCDADIIKHLRNFMNVESIREV